MAAPKSISRKQQRREQAQERQRLKPLRDAVKKIEKELAELRTQLAEFDEKLTDEAIYSDPDRKEELTDLVREQASARSEIESLEWQWLEASEKLEQA